MPAAAPKPRIEVRHISSGHHDCKHRFGPIEPGRYARWVRRCTRCRAVATIRLRQD